MTSTEANPATDAQLPFAGYDRLDMSDLVAQLCKRSQVELEAVDSYERSHEHRTAVLNKLRYLRGREPVPGYDVLSDEKIAAVLRDADLATVERMRNYERKFGNRRQVLEEVARVHRQRRAAQTPKAVPAYQPASARSGADTP